MMSLKKTKLYEILIMSGGAVAYLLSVLMIYLIEGMRNRLGQQLIDDGFDINIERLIKLSNVMISIATLMGYSFLGLILCGFGSLLCSLYKRNSFLK